ncbi:MAG: transglutaminase family protein [Propionibacteriaceae bacterium]|jgi:transglutaminase-like putative cysteine protease|nr:transglutaminase family protein [Propionibacteriaceae bacterium]
MRYHVRHLTQYRYDDEVEACFNRAYLIPRETAGQQVCSSSISATPEIQHLATHRDCFGNNSTSIELEAGGTQVAILSECEVETSETTAELPHIPIAEVARLAIPALNPVEFAEFTLPSPQIALTGGLRAFAASAMDEQTPLPQALSTLLARIKQTFAYRRGVTGVGTTLDEVLSAAAGVCQDFAHLAVGCLRALGLPSRYVSGYIETSPPPGRAKLRGADATHAWASVWTPAGWVDLDPTNEQFADSRYITLAWGRDFGDVSPLRGVVLTESSTSQLHVEVDVTAV